MDAFKKLFWSCLVVILIFIITGTATVFAAGDLSLNTRLSLMATPIPCSLVGEIKLDTPCEETILKWDIESIIDLDVMIGDMILSVDSAISIAHPEHFIITLDAKINDITIKPEIWFAVPFASASDVNNLSNTVVIPPGDTLFVTMRLTTSGYLGDIRFRNLAMFQDVNFPSPGTRWDQTDPLRYPTQSQSFAFGDILYLSGQTTGGISYSSRTGICAGGSCSVKKHSGSGVDPDCADGFDLSTIYESLSVSGFKIGGFNLSQSINLDLGRDSPFSASTGVSFSAFDWARVSASLNTFPLEFKMGGSIQLSADPFRFNISLPEMEFRSATFSIHHRFTLGAINGAFSTNASMIKERGLTSASMALFISKGTISASHSFALTKRDEGLKFSMLNIRINVRLSPFTFSISPVFGENGLTRLAVSSGVVF